MKPREFVDPGPEMTPQAAQRLRFRRAQRLSLPAEFALALRARPVAVGPHFQVFCPQVPTGARLGIIVGKRFVRRAVERNALKRLVRELFRVRRFELAPSHYLVRVRNPIRGIDKRTLKAELESLLKLNETAS